MKRRVIPFLLSAVLVLSSCGNSNPSPTPGPDPTPTPDPKPDDPTTRIIKANQAPLNLFYDEEAPFGNENVSLMTSSISGNTNDGWERWSFPLGNGFMGANVFGRTDSERIQVTEKTLCNPHASSALTYGGLNSFSDTYIDFGHDFSSVNNYERKLSLDNAVATVNYDYNGASFSREYFTSHKDNVMVIKLSSSNKNLNFTLRPTIPYLQDFALEGGLVSGKRNYDVTKHGKVVSSVDKNIGNIHLYGKMGYFGIDFDAQYRVFSDGEIKTGTWTNTYSKETYAEGFDFVSESTVDEFESGVRNETNQTLTVTNGTIEVSNAKNAYIVVGLNTNYDQTNYNGTNQQIFLETDDSKKMSRSSVNAERFALSKVEDVIYNYFTDYSLEEGYEKLRISHVNDYKSLFDRVKLELPYDQGDLEKTTDELLNDYKNGSFEVSNGGTYLETLYYQFGRYLAIASSREDSLPSNLQGTWNKYNYSPWGAGYWHNINEQMNYWMAFSSNLSETFEAYANFFNTWLASSRKQTDAMIKSSSIYKQNYDEGNCGWSVATSVTPFKVDVYSSDSPGNVGFTTQLFWEYYEYTQDINVLKNIVYPSLYEGANFITKVMGYDEESDTYLALYSDSPEQYKNGEWYYTKGTTYAQTFAYLNNYHLLEAAKILGKNIQSDKLLTLVNNQINKYDPINIGNSGQVKEFREEENYGDIGEYNHRHISQLVGLFPGELINSNTEAWLDGARYSLTERGDESTGWGVAHRLNLWARLKDGNRSYELLNQLIGENTATNLWDLHTPFQIDGNFGGTSGIDEMLLQSHEGYINPLSSIPDKWQKGVYTGLCAKGNFEVSSDFENGGLKLLNIKSKSGRDCVISYPNIATTVVKDSKGNVVSTNATGNDLISFATKAGETYIISSFNFVKSEKMIGTLDVSHSSRNSYELSWSCVNENVNFFNIYVAYDNEQNYSLIGSTESNEFVFNPTNDILYKRKTFKVVPVFSSGREGVGLLAYVNPINLTITGLDAINKNGTLQVSVETNKKPENYILLEKNGENWNEVSKTSYPLITYCNYDSSKEYRVKVINSYYSSLEKAITDVNEYVDYHGVYVEDTETNVFLGTPDSKLHVSGNSMHGSGNYPLSLGFDGIDSTTSRWAVGDKGPNAPYSVEMELEKGFNLKTMTISPFLLSGGSRSDKTTIEVFDGIKWSTVIDEEPLDNTKKTTFDLNFAYANKVRFTFNNTQAPLCASIQEITCTAAKVQYVDRSALLNAIKTAESISLEGLSTKQLNNYNDFMSSCYEKLSKKNLTIPEQNDVIDKLNRLPVAVSRKDIGALFSEPMFTGAETLYYNLASETKLDVTSGNYGKAEDDKVYLNNKVGDQYLYYNPLKENGDYLIEYNLLVNENSKFEMVIGDTFGSENTNGFIEALYIDGSNVCSETPNKEANGGKVIAINDQAVEETTKVTTLSVNEWHKIAVVFSTDDLINNTIDIYINGVKYTIALANKEDITGFRNAGLKNLKGSFYFDNFNFQQEKETSFEQIRDEQIKVTASMADEYSGGVLKYNTPLTVNELAQKIGHNIRVYDQSGNLLDSSVTLTSGTYNVVIYSKGNTTNERTYKYVQALVK